MEIKDVIKYYSDIIDYQEAVLSRLKRTIFQIGTARLVIAILCMIGVYWFWSQREAVVLIVLISFIIFLVLMRYHGRLFKRKKYSEQKIMNARNELKGIDYDFSAFDGSPEKISADHSFSLDLDLFGERSFFQSVNRTVTSFGKDYLADTLIHPLEDNESISVRQRALEELKQNPKLLDHFRAIGQTSETDTLNTKDFAESFSYPVLLSKSKLWRALVYLFPALYLVLGVLVYMEIASSTFFVVLYLLTFAISSIPHKKVSLVMGTFDRKSKVLGTYSELFQIIENENFESELLQNIQKELKTGERASKAIEKLRSLHNKLMMSDAYPILLFINPVLLWNVSYAIKVESWTLKHKSNIKTWFDSIAQFDAMVSWAVFGFNHPDYVYPSPADKFIFKGSSLGHPLLNRDACVRNDVDISRTPYFLVITGANMAGKSTYLRTIGINHTLACAGAPVCAQSLEFYPGRLVTNLRTADSLADNESYFFAELKRLKMIIDRLQSGEELFIILDEILKGTNSVDKQKGSLALMKQLISLNGNGIIATHDLLLGQLEKEYPGSVKNYRFEADITNDRLSFTYKIREGVAENMNATFLMKQMGITGLD